MNDVRARFDDAELATVLGYYDIGTIIHSQEMPRGSREAAKLLIKTTKGRFLLKRRPKGKDDPFRVAFAHELQNYLAARAFPLPHIIGTRDDNNSMIKLADATYEIFEFIPGEGFDTTPQAAMEAGKIMAVFHGLVRDMPYEFEPPTGGYHDASRVRALLERIAGTLADLPGAPSAVGQAQPVRTLIGALRESYDAAAQSVIAREFDDWAVQIVHGDWHPGNVLFHDHHVVAVLDFDSARLAPPITDLANASLQFSMRSGDRNPENWPEDCNESRLTGFVSGYDGLRRLSVAEVACIPALMTEALIAESVGPIAATGSFAKIDGYAFLKTVLRKVRWLEEHGPRLVRMLGDR